MTKRDRADPSAAAAEAAALLARAGLEAEAPVAVSALTGEGLGELRAALARAADAAEAAADDGWPWLPVDRAFHMSGHGVVVTGTLQRGRLARGDELELLPAGRRVRVRGLQVHGRSVQAASPGQRTAVNLRGVELADVGARVGAGRTRPAAARRVAHRARHRAARRGGAAARGAAAAPVRHGGDPRAPAPAGGRRGGARRVRPRPAARGRARRRPGADALHPAPPVPRRDRGGRPRARSRRAPPAPRRRRRRAGVARAAGRGGPRRSGRGSRWSGRARRARPSPGWRSSRARRRRGRRRRSGAWPPSASAGTWPC